MVASDGTVLLGVVLVLVVGAAVAGGAALVLWRRLRRRARALRSDATVRALLALAGAWRSGPRGLGPAASRAELWWAVGAATRAVADAERATGEPLGDLRALARRLRESALDVDRLLSMASGMPAQAAEEAGVRGHVAETLAAASAIRRAALLSATDAASVRLGALASDAGRELDAVSAGIARWKEA